MARRSGVIRTAWSDGRLDHVYASETTTVAPGGSVDRLGASPRGNRRKPGSRFSNWTADATRHGPVCHVVGADRIALNGDVANKIGTYNLAVLAKENGIPFYVAAPTSTFDPGTSTGDEIVIEERDENEVLGYAGSQVAPEGISGFNPAFDVTPNRYITGIVSEAGVGRPPYRRSIPAILEESNA